ncbi:hypothetical protein PHMEG_00017458 [Phytophthora megakarya]|uniref:Uncharacterized protein n=1 Tax=Phytophthora megakarya TaxID=4795 RepID=A0A225VY12_9STRA|nr:hypothetical protein PHMEG_00017458 [Phytophthora megakarya]
MSKKLKTAASDVGEDATEFGTHLSDGATALSPKARIAWRLNTSVGGAPYARMDGATLTQLTTKLTHGGWRSIRQSFGETTSIERTPTPHPGGRRLTYNELHYCPQTCSDYTVTERKDAHQMPWIQQRSKTPLMS